MLTILDLLGRTEDRVARADLAMELVRVAARYEDAKERALYRALEEAGASELARELSREQERIRALLHEVRDRTKNTAPQDVYLSEPEDFERALRELSALLGDHAEREERQAFPLVAELDADRRESLRADLHKAHGTASEHPTPPKNPIARAVVSAVTKIDHAFDDSPTRAHPGREQLPEP